MSLQVLLTLVLLCVVSVNSQIGLRSNSSVVSNYTNTSTNTSTNITTNTSTKCKTWCMTVERVVIDGLPQHVVYLSPKETLCLDKDSILNTTCIPPTPPPEKEIGEFQIAKPFIILISLLSTMFLIYRLCKQSKTKKPVTKTDGSAGARTYKVSGINTEPSVV